MHPFERKEELYKVYNLDSSFVESALPFVEIEDPPVEKLILVELNSADSLELISIKGIGPVYAHRILSYRKSLGGYYAKRQILEIYGMDQQQYENVEAYFTVDQSLIKRMNINSAEFKQLVSHPYLNYEQVRNILTFRDEVRPYQSIDELRNIELIDDTLFSKIANYLNLSSEEIGKSDQKLH